METRRNFIRLTSASLGALLIGSAGRVRAQAAPSLIDQLETICHRLAPLGWRSMMLAVTGGALDITAPDLARELAKQVPIDRSYRQLRILSPVPAYFAAMMQLPAQHIRTDRLARQIEAVERLPNVLA